MAAEHRVITWDWRQQPDQDELTAAIRDVSAGTVHARYVDTGSDEYALVIAAVPLDDATAQDIYDRWEATDGR